LGDYTKTSTMISLKPPLISYKFLKKCSDSRSEPSKKIEMIIYEDANLEQLIETFESFLLASGFYLAEDEKLAIIKESSSEDNLNDECNTDL